MEHPDRPSPAAEDVDLTALRELQRHWQMLFMVTMVGLIILSVGAAFFIFKQMRMVQYQVMEQRPAVQRMTADYQRASEPLIRNFSAAISQYAATNAGFRPILEKYRPALSNYFGAPLPAAVPAPEATNR